MQNETDKLIQEQFAKLPTNVQQAISAIPWEALVQEIGKENALDPEQILTLVQETMFIIYAFEPPEVYVANLMRELSIPEDAAGKLANAVEEKILKTILAKTEQTTDSTQKMEASPTSVPEVAPEVHPSSIPGETAHDTTPEEKKFMNMGNVQTPAVENKEQKAVESSDTPEPPKQTSYPGGKDPYREPIE